MTRRGDEDQGGLFEPRPRPTSVQAYHQAKAAGTVGQLQRRVLAGVRDFGPATAREICRDARVPEGWRRFSELRRDGHIKIVGERICSVTSKTAMVWALGPDLAAKPGLPRSIEVTALRAEVAEPRDALSDLLDVTEGMSAAAIDAARAVLGRRP